MLVVGERLWNGTIVTKYLADAYNNVSERIRKFEEDGKPVPEYLLNGRHNLLTSKV